MLAYLASGSIIKALMMGTLGMIIGCIGMDSITGTMRFAYGIQILFDGVGIVPVIMGLFGVSEVLLNVESDIGKRDLFLTKVKGLFPNREEWKRSIGAILRGTGIGFLLGILPAGSHYLLFHVLYGGKALIQTSEKFGTGMIEGSPVRRPQTMRPVTERSSIADPGIPCNAVIAIISGALIIHGVQPGPMLISEAPTFSGASYRVCIWEIFCFSS